MNLLITSIKAAELLCISEKTLRKWRWEGKGPKFVKIGSRVTYRVHDLQEWIKDQIRTSTSDDGGNHA